ncbi:MAG: glycosyltransferase [Candidatus Binataceae bacterium]
MSDDFPPLKAPKDFPSLEVDPSAPRRQVRICIVTPEFVGPTRNGGIGTAYTTLAQILVRAGHEVTVLYTGGDWSDSGSVEEWEKYYLAQGILLIRQKPPVGTVVDSPFFVKRSYEAFLWLKRNESRFDIVHFPEWQGQAYYSLLAKHQGIAFQNLSFCVGAHSSGKWIELGNLRLFKQSDQLDQDFLERESVRLADVVISPSQYLLRWMQEDAWRLPDRVYVAPYAVPPELYTSVENARRGQSRLVKRELIEELIFFGRLEPRKGLVIFCDAVDRLTKPPYTGRRLRVTFLGKPWLVNGEDAASYVRSRSQNWPLETQILTKDRSEALSYLRETSGGLVIIPSLLDNHPNTILECLALRLPFLASDVGGIPEQIRISDRLQVLFTPRADCLAEKIAEAIKTAPKPAEPAFDFASNNETLVKWHEQFISSPPKTTQASTRGERPLVSVCLTHFNRPVYLRWALESLRKQDHSWPFEVILVDDGSTTEEAKAYLERLEPEFHQRDWRIVKQDNRYLGAARNAAARNSRGKYLLFMDDDNYADPSEVSILAGIAERTGADILTCAVRGWSGNESPDETKVAAQLQWVPLGPAIESGLFWNAFGDANALIKREVFETLKGFVEVHGTTFEDWEFFARAVFSGFDLQVVPLPLFWYRLHGQSMRQVTDDIANRLLAIKPYLELTPQSLRNIFLLSLGQKLDLEKLRNGQPPPTPPPTPNDTGVSTVLMSEIDTLWASRSWQMFRPFRNLHRRWKGLGREIKPIPQSSAEAAQMIIDLRQSLSWELSSPLRIIHRMLASRSSG